MIPTRQSDFERLALAQGEALTHREHRYRGGPPSLRLRRLQAAHEVRARKANVSWDFVDLRIVYKKSKGLCGICAQPVDEATFTIDHIVPMSKGGAHLIENLQAAHRSCNSRKGNR